MHLPTVSIGMPVYNGAEFICPALDSILQQDYGDFELIISDNASTDKTPEICGRYAAMDKRVRYFRNETNIGAARNYNKVFHLARASLFKWAAHDDVHLPGFLSRCVEVMEQAPPSVVLVAPKTEIIDEKGKKIVFDWCAESLHTERRRPYQRVADVLWKIDWATAQFGVFRSEALRQTRLIDRFIACDYVLMMELAILGEIWEIPEVLFQRRYHSGISTEVNRTQEEFLQWFDPSVKAKRVFMPKVAPALRPRVQLVFEYARSIHRMPINSNERFRCLSVALFIWLIRELRRLRREYREILSIKVRKSVSCAKRP